MALSLNIDDQDLPSIFKILGLGGMPQEAQDTGDNDFSASGGVATHPGFGGGGDGTRYQPDVNYSDAKANSMLQPDNPPAIDPSLGGASDPNAQPRSLFQVMSAAPTPQPTTQGPNTSVPSTHNQSAPPTKLLRLQQAIGTAPPQAQPQSLEDALMSGPATPPQPAAPAPTVQPRSLMDVLANKPATPQGFAQNHPRAASILTNLANFVQDAGAGAGAKTFGEGSQAATESGQRRRTLALQNAKSAADTAHVNAETQAIINPPGKPTAPEIMFDKAGNALGYRDKNGNVLGANNPNLPPDIKQMLDAAEGRATAQGTPESQAMAYLVKNGHTPADAYQMIQDSKAEARPDTATQDKQRGRQLENKLSAGTLTPNERDELTARQQEAKLQGIPSEIVSQVGRPPVPAQFPQGKGDPDFLAADKDWGSKVEAVKSREAGAAAGARGQAYGEFRPVQVIDPSSGELRWAYARDAIASGAAPAAGGAKAMSQQQQFKEMSVASSKARDAINGLDRDFTAPQIAKLTLAFSHDDPGIANNEINTLLGTQQLTQKQEDFVVWLNQLNERALSLRSVAGMGQGAQDLRSAIQSTLPSLRSGGKSMALKQLDAFDNQVTLLQQGIPKVRGAGGSQTQQNSNSSGSNGDLPPLQAGYTRFQDSQGAVHDIPSGNLQKAKQRDPNLQVIQ